MKVLGFSKGQFFSYLIAVVISVFLVAAFVFGATTISNNINTGGTLTATGLSTLDGGVLVNNSTSTITNLVMINATSTNATTTAFNISGPLVANGASSTITNLNATTLVSTNATNTSATSTSFYVSGALRVAAASSTITTLRASTLTLGGGTNHTAFVSGACNIATAVTVTASSTAFADCASATGVQAGDRVFVTATSSLPNSLIVQAASSTAADTINLRVYNTGYNNGAPSGNVSTGVISLFFWATR